MRLENTFIGAEGVGETTERRIWERGVTHWDEFERDVIGGQRGRNVERFVQEAWTHLDDGNAGFFDDRLPSGERWRLYENFADSACFFDIETTGLDQHRDRVTTVSFHRNGETDTLVAGEDLTAAALREQFDPADLIVTFNGKRFDVPFLETSFAVDIDLPHLDLMYTCKKLDLSGGLKRVESEVGIERDRPDISGRDAVRLWREYERGDREALETLISYNREDAVNLERLLETVTGDLHERVFERARRGELD